MYFGRDGAVSACCYSRSAHIGRYPDQSIEEIWTSAQAIAMRAAMRQNEFPSGCELCADQFHAGNFGGFLARQYDGNARTLERAGWLDRLRSVVQPDRIKQYPVRLDFELSNKCNLECSMCTGFFSSSIRANRDNLPPLPQSYDKSFIRQLLPFLPHLTHAKFLGGEPFLIDLYYDIWENLMKVNPRCDVAITTNGTVYTDKVKRVLETLNCEIIVSLDSITKSTYESIRQNATLERTLANLESFSAINRKKGKCLVIAICPMISNYREIPALMAFAAERRLRVFFNTVVQPEAHSLKALSRTEQREALELFHAIMPEPRDPVERANREALEGLCRQITRWMNEELSFVGEKCAQLLQVHARSGYLSLVLRDLAGRGAPEIVSLADIQDADPIKSLTGYLGAMWEAAALLQAAGVLQGYSYEPAKLGSCLEYIQANVGPERARLVQGDMRRYARQSLQHLGTYSGAELSQMLSGPSGQQ